MSRRGVLAVGVLGVAALAWSPPMPRLVWNVTASAPLGLYRVEFGLPPARGDLVLARLPETVRTLAAERSYLPKTVPVVKRVAAMAGDRICGVGDDIIVGGGIAARRLPADGQGRALPAWQGCHVLLGNEVFLLMEGVPDSFDGRYFGPTETSQIIGRLVPLWTR
jgi:conjugative transfer signal peptidase TraF